MPNKTVQVTVAAEKKLCECGCGELIPAINKRGEPARFKHGHYQKVMVGPKHPSWRGGKHVSRGYVLIWKPEHPSANTDGYVLEHRLLMEEYLGRYLSAEEDVHHINGNTQDNRVENLQLMFHGEHSRLTHTIDMAERSCNQCGNNGTYTAKDGITNWYLSFITNRIICNRCYMKEWRQIKRITAS